MSNRLRDALALIHAGQCAQYQHHAKQGRITGISIAQHADLLREHTGRALAMVTGDTLPDMIRALIENEEPAALSDPYVRQALARLVEAIEEATAPADA